MAAFTLHSPRLNKAKFGAKLLGQQAFLLESEDKFEKAKSYYVSIGTTTSSESDFGV